MIFCLNRQNEVFQRIIISQNRFNILRQLKLGPAKTFCKIGTKSRFLTPLLEEAYSYDYAERPNYGKLKFLIEKMLMNEDQIPDKNYSWVQNLTPLVELDQNNEENKSQ